MMFRSQRRPSSHARTGLATFHTLRRIYASALAMKGVPLGMIAKQLGHADTRITERHYPHLCPNYVDEIVRACCRRLGTSINQT